MKISNSVNLHSLKTSALKAFWALDQLENNEKDRFTIGDIVKCLLEDNRIKVSRQALGHGLKIKGAMVHKNKEGYKLMENGRDELRRFANKDFVSKDKDGVISIGPGKPFSAKNIELREILSPFKGDTFITDPYIDVSTLDFIFKNFSKRCSVRVLTTKITDKPEGIFKRTLIDIQKEGHEIEVRNLSQPELHDRYIMNSEKILFSGNSFNRLGNKESFIIPVDMEIQKGMIKIFNERWENAEVI